MDNIINSDDPRLWLELILTNGRVIDPAQNLDGVYEVGLQGERIAALGTGLPRTARTRVLDCRGLLVVPGLIDMHVHVYPGATDLGLHPDHLLQQGGATTMLDCGSAGCDTYRGLYDDVIAKSRSRVLALLHICSTGLAGRRQGELLSPHLADAEKTAEAILAHSPQTVGVKIRMGSHLIGDARQGTHLLRLAARAARASGSVLMVHIGASPIGIPEILAELQPGDVITHCYQGWERRPCLLDEQRRLFPAVLAAQQAGIRFDVGHGMGSFSWDSAGSACEQGLAPFTISTDLHTFSIDHPVIDLPTTMSKFLLLGMPLPAVIRCCTYNPAVTIGRAHEIGSLHPGMTADITLLRERTGTRELFDSYGQKRIAGHWLETAGVIRAGCLLRAPGCCAEEVA